MTIATRSSETACAESINESDRYELPYNLYEIIGNKAALLKEEGLEQGAINNFIMTDINVHLKSFYRDNKILRTEKNLNELVDLPRRTRSLAKRDIPSLMFWGSCSNFKLICSA